jgi:gliding motility-associated-like protein
MRSAGCFLLLVLSSIYLYSQDICDGNLGSNIFLDGDFGSGLPNIPPNDPGIAPGYIYTTNPPPNDGFYTITNNTSSWPNFPTWLSIMDNSNDNTGYMMVVNASFDTGKFYEQTIDGLCGNTLYEFTADIINLIAPGVNGHILPNVSFLLDDVEEYTTGNIPQNGSWNTYGFVFSTLPGQTSIKLTLRNNAPGGIGNDLALDNISFRACGPEALILPVEIENICEDGDPIELFATVVGDQYPDPAFQWQQSFDEGLSWQDIPGANGNSIMHTNLNAGFYYYRYLLANATDNLENSKCRVNSNVKIVFVQPKFYEFTDTVCEGDTYLLGDEAFSDSGIYVDSLTSSIGCDSIVTLDLTVVPDNGITADLMPSPPSCPGSSDGTVTINQLANGYPPYEILLGTEAMAGPEALFSNLEAGTYAIEITDRYGCRLDTAALVPASEALTLELGPDQTVNLGEGIQLPLLSTAPLSSISWFPETGLNCDDSCLAPFILPPQTTTYTLTIGSDAGCSVSDSLTITVLEVREVYIPSAFSPNDDGRNDRFTVYGNTPNVQALHLQVFNRWGGLVYEAVDMLPNTDGWDGTFKGEKLGNDVFTYLAKVRFLDDKEIIYTGEVNLLR